MNSIRYIRKVVFPNISQGELAKITGTTQATVSRWESGELSPNLSEMQLIRDSAQARGIEWDDALFFTGPQAEHSEAEA